MAKQMVKPAMRGSFGAMGKLVPKKTTSGQSGAFMQKMMSGAKKATPKASPTYGKKIAVKKAATKPYGMGKG